jgi:hypothetical protein
MFKLPNSMSLWLCVAKKAAWGYHGIRTKVGYYGLGFTELFQHLAAPCTEL